MRYEVIEEVPTHFVGIDEAGTAYGRYEVPPEVLYRSRSKRRAERIADRYRETGRARISVRPA